jgi:hypothetical protein
MPASARGEDDRNRLSQVITRLVPAAVASASARPSREAVQSRLAWLLAAAGHIHFLQVAFIANFSLLTYDVRHGSVRTQAPDKSGSDCSVTRLC